MSSILYPSAGTASASTNSRYGLFPTAAVKIVIGKSAGFDGVAMWRIGLSWARFNAGRHPAPITRRRRR
ncbi:hypothetical protein EBN03_10985 [Nocardia stercoris]|uniref:Uncharacterized protein n=1 Tax=Nocardia stercoris TaxID=2483361 RepID=A0A3M2L974_9NOCA|nr:hypothetical protein EBN03_10985 [Nocardia stercoris]